jgi:hypothetical protein
MRRDIINEVILLPWRPAKNLPQRPRLHEVLVRDAELEVRRRARPGLLRGREGAGLLQRAECRGVVGQRAGVSVHGHESVTLVRVVHVKRSVDGDLLVVDAEAVALGVGVGEEAGLEDRVSGGFDAGHQVGWGEGDLFDFGEVVLGLRGVSINMLISEAGRWDYIAVESEFADLSERDVFLGPDFG